MNMTYEEFKSYVVENIADYLPIDMNIQSIDINEIIKTNDIKLDGLCIRLENQNITPTIYLNDIYEKYQDSDMDVNDTLKQIAYTYVKNCNPPEINVHQVTDFENMKDKIIFRVVNYDSNMEMLSQCPYRTCEDLAMTYHAVVAISDSNTATFRITNDIMKHWGINEQQLYELASKNTPELFPAEFESMENVILGMEVKVMMESGCFETEQEARMVAKENMEAMGVPFDAESSIYVLSNNLKIDGAATLFYPDQMKKIANSIGSDFYILPSSTHEVLIYPKRDNVSVNDLRTTVREVNATMVDPKEVLSDRVYEFNADKNRFKVAETSQMREFDR